MSNEERGGRLWLCNHVKLLERRAMKTKKNKKENEKTCLCVICKGWIDAIGGKIIIEGQEKWGGILN